MAPKRAFPSANGGRGESPTRSGGSKRLCSGRHDQGCTLQELTEKLNPSDLQLVFNILCRGSMLQEFIEKPNPSDLQLVFNILCRGCTLQEFMEKLNPSDLQLVKNLCRKYGVNVPHLSSRTRMYRLQFRNNLQNVLFTDRTLKAENEMKVEIAIVDASNMVISSGPEAKAEIEIVVIDGDIHEVDNGECTEEEFNKHLIVARKDKPPLLSGNLFIKLCDGVGYITDAKFTDNSSWTKSKNFRLGARLHQGEGMAVKVQEGISNAFRVKDRHGEKNQKDRPPCMNDGVWCLKGISKNSPYKQELAKYQINTVGDLLSYCRANPHEKLYTKIGMKEGAWKKTYGHAIESLALINSPVSLHTSDQMIGMTERAREETYGHATAFESLSDFIRNIPDNLLATDQNSFEVVGSNSSQNSHVRVQPDGIMQSPSNVECESNRFTSAESLPATKSGTDKFGHIWLQLFYVARCKVIVRRSREGSWPQCKNSSPRLTPDEDIDERAWEKTYGHATESESWSDILYSPGHLQAFDQIYLEFAGSNSSQIPNVWVQPYGIMQSLSNIDFESGGIGGKGTEQFDIPPEVQMKGVTSLHRIGKEYQRLI